MKYFKYSTITAIFLSATLLTLSSCGNSNPPLDGFKSIKFGMSKSELEAMGFHCESRECKDDQGDSKSQTLFGKPASIQIEMTDKEITSIIRVYIRGMEDEELLQLFTKALGKPRERDFVNFGLQQMRESYWISPEGTSISVVNAIVKKPREKIFGVDTGPLTIAYYRDKNNTAERWSKTKDSSVNKKDF